MPSRKAGYIVWQDNKIVIFYCNNLLTTPSRPVIDGEDAKLFVVCKD